MKKLLLVLGFATLILVNSSNLYACGGEGGESNPDSDMFGDLILGTLKMNHFTPENQNYIPKEILNINILTAKERENKKRKQEIQEKMRWQEEIARREITMGNVQDAKVKLAAGAIIAAGIGLAVVSGGATVAGEISGAEAFGAGVGFSAATAGVQSAAEKKSGKEIFGNMARAAIQSAAIGVFLPTSPIKGGLLDAGLGMFPTKPNKMPAHMDGLKDYGPGHVDLQNGTKVMK